MRALLFALLALALAPSLALAEGMQLPAPNGISTNMVGMACPNTAMTAWVKCSDPTAAPMTVSGSVGLQPGSYTSGSQIVPTTATTVLAAPSSGSTRVRIVGIDTAIAAGTSAVVSIWCAWGAAGANPAVIGSNGFPLNAGFDDSGLGVNQLALNCIQAAGAGHYARLETY